MTAPKTETAFERSVVRLWRKGWSTEQIAARFIGTNSEAEIVRVLSYRFAASLFDKRPR